MTRSAAAWSDMAHPPAPDQSGYGQLNALPCTSRMTEDRLSPQPIRVLTSPPAPLSASHRPGGSHAAMAERGEDFMGRRGAAGPPPSFPKTSSPSPGRESWVEKPRIRPGRGSKGVGDLPGSCVCRLGNGIRIVCRWDSITSSEHPARARDRGIETDPARCVRGEPRQGHRDRRPHPGKRPLGRHEGGNEVSASTGPCSAAGLGVRGGSSVGSRMDGRRNRR